MRTGSAGCSCLSPECLAPMYRASCLASLSLSLSSHSLSLLDGTSCAPNTVRPYSSVQYCHPAGSPARESTVSQFVWCSKSMSEGLRSHFHMSKCLLRFISKNWFPWFSPAGGYLCLASPIARTGQVSTLVCLSLRHRPQQRQVFRNEAGP